MAAPGLSRQRAGDRGPALARAWLSAYLWLWALTLAGAGLAALVAPAPAREVLHLTLAGRRAPPASLGRTLELLAHNLPIAAWPLLLSRLRTHEHAGARALADATVVLCALANALPVAIALGGYGTALLAYVPQLPLEWAALALGYGSWRVQREHPLAPRVRLALLALIGLLMAAAAVLETVAVPTA
jgi:hypothetical protein